MLSTSNKKDHHEEPQTKKQRTDNVPATAAASSSSSSSSASSSSSSSTTTSSTSSTSTSTSTNNVPLHVATSTTGARPIRRQTSQGTSDLVAVRDMDEGTNSLKVKIFSSVKFLPEFFELPTECTHTTGLPTNFKAGKKLGFHRVRSQAHEHKQDGQHVPKYLQDPEFVSTCDECGTEPSAEHDTWICLHCSVTLCGRDSANKHMEKHTLTDKDHCIVMSLTDGNIWCYKCDGYLEHTFYPELQPFYRRFHKEKFGQRPENDRMPLIRSVSNLKACAHCDTLSHKGFKDTAAFKATGCSVCHTSGDDEVGNWVCLVCEQVFCSRFNVGRHGVEHWKQTGHSVSMSLKDGSIWCYSCGEHQDHSSSSNLSAFFAAFHVARHSEVPPLRSLKRMNSLLNGSTLTESESSLLSDFNAEEFRWGGGSQ
jgi:hypothetical protein